MQQMNPESPPDAPLGKLSVIVAARNEGHTVEKGLRSLAMQDHPDYEIIAINDRSEDNTGEIIDRVAAEMPDRIKTLHITELPEGWLGKCNALHQGGEVATGEYILFTDADVEFEITALQRTHLYARQEQADQLAVFPETLAGSVAEQSMMLSFALCFFIGFPPHRAMKRNSGAYVGVGAFNMISTAMYRKIQGHRFLRLLVVDDVGLGKLVKYSGGVVRVAWGNDFVKVRWQESLWGMIRGLEKNFFASTNYSVLKTLLMAVGVSIAFVWPWVGVWTGSTASRVLCGVALATQLIVAAATAKRMKFSVVAAPLLPLGAIFLITSMLRSMVITLKNGGITWRNQFYALKDLKQFKL